MLSLVLFRGALLATPFAAWFIWRAWARRSGREMGSTPWSWLFAIGALLVALSLMATAFFRPDNRDGVYVPGEVQADGTVTEGRFVEPAPK
ncbi:MAG: hypothetical protein ABW360_06570 [Phenylobacterium sp.]